MQVPFGSNVDSTGLLCVCCYSSAEENRSLGDRERSAERTHRRRKQNSTISIEKSMISIEKLKKKKKLIIFIEKS